jgi:hypothetical protein
MNPAFVSRVRTVSAVLLLASMALVEPLSVAMESPGQEGNHRKREAHMDGKSKPNRLVNEKSPYLRQHAYNPVDWYPWAQEAFARARS